MFGGSEKGNPGFPGFMENNHLQYDPNTVPQLQLFVPPTGCKVNPLNYIGNEQAAASNQPAAKRCRELEPNSSQQKLHFSLKNNNNNNSSFCQDGSGRVGRMLVNLNQVSTGLRLSNEEEERNNSSVTCSSEGMRAPLPGIFALGDSLKLEMDQQKEELDNYMRLQEANLLKGIRELKHKQSVRFLNTLEKGVAKKLHEKDLEIETINRKNKELTEKIKQLATDAQCWHYKAQYNESVVNALKSNLQQIVAQGPVQAREGFGDSELDDAASYANFGNNVHGNKFSKCRACKTKEASVLLMPCRHLCLCTECEGFADICPVCQVMKTASVQVFMS